MGTDYTLPIGQSISGDDCAELFCEQHPEGDFTGGEGGWRRGIPSLCKDYTTYGPAHHCNGGPDDRAGLLEQLDQRIVLYHKVGAVQRAAAVKPDADELTGAGGGSILRNGRIGDDTDHVLKNGYGGCRGTSGYGYLSVFPEVFCKGNIDGGCEGLTATRLVLGFYAFEFYGYGGKIMVNRIMTATNEAFKLRGGYGSQEAKELRQLIATRNETASFQLLLGTGRHMKVSVGKHNNLSSRLPIERYRIEIDAPFAARPYLEGYLKDENGIPCADILLTEPEKEYDGSMPVAIWVDLPVPADAVPGEYVITARAYHSIGPAEEVLAEELTFSMTVLDFAMPGGKEYGIYVDLWQQNSNIARTFGVDLWSEEHFAILDKVVASLADIGQKSVTVLASDCPWRGWACHLLRSTPANLYEYSMVLVKKGKDGVYRYDFSILQRYIDLCASHGIDGDITVYGLIGLWKMPLFQAPEIPDYPERVMVRYKDEADGCYRYMDRKEDVIAYIKALTGYFEETGQIEKVRIAADEPSDLEAYRKSLGIIRGVAPKVKFKMALDHAEVIREFTEEIEDVAASFPCTCSENEFLHKHKEEYPSKRLLWYVCNIPWNKPNSVLHNHLLDTRVLGSLNKVFGFDGFLRWAYSCWPDNPRQEICYNELYLPAGDVNFIYPALDGGIALSLRYKALKRGFEDYELMKRLQEKGKFGIVEEALQKIIYQPDISKYMKTDKIAEEGIYSTDYNDYVAMRQLLVKGLME